MGNKEYVIYENFYIIEENGETSGEAAVEGDYIPIITEEDLRSFFEKDMTEEMTVVADEMHLSRENIVGFEMATISYYSGHPYAGFYSVITPDGVEYYWYNLKSKNKSLWNDNIMGFCELVAKVGAEKFEVFIKNEGDTKQTT